MYEIFISSNFTDCLSVFQVVKQWCLAQLIFPGITFESHIDIKIVAVYEITKLLKLRLSISGLSGQYVAIQRPNQAMS